MEFATIDRENNFDLIRLFAALQVALLHLKYHMDIKTNYDFVFQILSHFQGVPIFFTVSGFLITAAWYRNQNIKKYIKSRFLRIYPGLYVCFALTLGMLIFVGLINQHNFLSKQSLVWYFFSLFTIYPNITPPMLKQLQAGDPNGSLWTLPIELQFYIILPLLFIFIIKRKYIFLLILFALFSSIIYYIIPKLTIIGLNSTINSFISCSVLKYFWNFSVGIFIYIYWRKIKYYFYGQFIWWLVLYISLVIFITIFHQIFINSEVIKLIQNTVLGCVIISFAFTNPSMSHFLRGNDISYGIYIYHMPIANIFIEKGLVQSQIIYFFVLMIVLFFSFISWCYIEKPFLQLK